MNTWEDAEGHTRSSLSVVQRMSILLFFYLSNEKGANVQSNTLPGTLEVLKRPDNHGSSDESH
jgi:hypothetical protein